MNGELERIIGELANIRFAATRRAAEYRETLQSLENTIKELTNRAVCNKIKINNIIIELIWESTMFEDTEIKILKRILIPKVDINELKKIKEYLTNIVTMITLIEEIEEKEDYLLPREKEEYEEAKRIVSDILNTICI